MPADLSVREMRVTHDDLLRFKSCFDRNEDAPRDLGALEWQYLRNPVGRVLVSFAADGAADDAPIAGVYAVFPVSFRVAGRDVLGAQSLDTLTDVDYRGRGVFGTLARAVYARCAREDVALVYGFPNGSSAPGFFGKLGWQPLDPVPFLIRPLRTRYFGARVPRIGNALRALPDLPLPRPGRTRLVPGWRFERLTALDERVDALWDAFSRVVNVGVRRDRAYLAWRLLDKPHARYEVLGLFDGSRLIGLTALTVLDKHGGRIGYVLEAMFDPAVPDAAHLLVREATRRIAERGADAALAWSFPHAPNARAFARAGYVVMPERLRPIELHLGARALDAALAPVLADRRNWYISYCDSDTV
jgi:GNAT superfamily N-acetyltransferase